jgi:predicted dehydrogenase
MNSSQGIQGRVLSRRGFLQHTSKVIAAGTLASSPAWGQGVHVSGNAELRIGLIGCGGRGTGAAAQALAADKEVKLVAMGDAFSDRLQSSLETLQKQKDIAAKIDVPAQRWFVGFDAYKQVIEHSDVVLLATPPHFRPMHIRAAVEAGRHVFAEKPVAVDAVGVRSVLASCEQARQKKLAVVSGLAMRYSYQYRETVKRIHDGALGEIRTLQANDYRGPIWVKPRQPGWTDMEWHMRNWYYFTWLSGDFNVEQHVHMLDLCSWIMRDEPPVRAYGTGGRQVRTGPEYGNIYDHHSIVYGNRSRVE